MYTQVRALEIQQLKRNGRDATHTRHIQGETGLPRHTGGSKGQRLHTRLYVTCWSSLSASSHVEIVPVCVGFEFQRPIWVNKIVMFSLFCFETSAIEKRIPVPWASLQNPVAQLFAQTSRTRSLAFVEKEGTCFTS